MFWKIFFESLALIVGFIIVGRLLAALFERMRNG